MHLTFRLPINLVVVLTFILALSPALRIDNIVRSLLINFFSFNYQTNASYDNPTDKSKD